MVVDAIFWFGVRGYEGIMVDVWESLCQRATNILEIGGNIGFYTVVGGKASRGHYTVVEPLPVLAKTIESNLAHNGLNFDRVSVLQAAAIGDDSPAEVLINIPDEGRRAPVGAHLVDGVELAERSCTDRLKVPGIPFIQLSRGKDLIKIDAEGIEASLLTNAWPVINAERPVLALEVLPEAHGLAALIREIATSQDYLIHVVPAYGSRSITTVAPAEFSAATPAKCNSKDIILSRHRLASNDFRLS
jgi:FkbM family methyltransferase